jgi:hypothetical protein
MPSESIRPGVRARLLLCLAPLALGVVAAGCGGDDETEPTPTVAEGEHVPAKTLLRCLQKAGLETGEPGTDAILGAYGEEAVAAGGDTFVVVDPISQIIVFPDPVDLEDAEDELRRVAERSGARALGLQGDAYGNVLMVYFNPNGADKTPVNECLGATAEAVPGFATPFQPTGLTPEIVP